MLSFAKIFLQKAGSSGIGNSFYVPNFEEVEEEYWFGPVCPSVRLCVTLALGQEPLEIGS